MRVSTERGHHARAAVFNIVGNNCTTSFSKNSAPAFVLSLGLPTTVGEIIRVLLTNGTTFDTIRAMYPGLIL